MRALRLIPPARSYLEELKIKPQNEFARGLFVGRRRRGLRRGATRPKTQLAPGAMFPQAWIERVTVLEDSYWDRKRDTWNNTDANATWSSCDDGDAHNGTERDVNAGVTEVSDDRDRDGMEEVRS